MLNHKVYTVSTDEYDKLIELEAGVCLVCAKVYEQTGKQSLCGHCTRCGSKSVFGVDQALAMCWINVQSK
jgi:hypothetical protein